MAASEAALREKVADAKLAVAAAAAAAAAEAAGPVAAVLPSTEEAATDYLAPVEAAATAAGQLVVDERPAHPIPAAAIAMLRAAPAPRAAAALPWLTPEPPPPLVAPALAPFLSAAQLAALAAAAADVEKAEAAMPRRRGI